MSHHIKRSVILAILAVLVGLAAAKSELLAYAGHTCPPSAEEGVKHVNPGDDLDAIVNSDPATSATTFCIHAGTYLIDSVVVPRDGDALLGEPGRSTVLGPATKPEPVVLVRNGAALSRLVQPTGANIHLEWLDISGANVRYNSLARDTCRNWGELANKCPQAGTGVAIASGYADGTLVVSHVRIWGNEGLGIGSAKGRVLHSEFTDNTRNPDWVGFEGAGVKGVTEFEAAHNFVHDEQGNGLWCDHACADDATRMNGAWFHHNLIVNNANWGLRYEFSPIVASGVHSSQPTFLAENNEIHGNGAGGASMVDAQTGTFRANNFGPTKIAGVYYAANFKNRAIFFRDSGRAERTDLWKGDATGNEFNGETMVGCEKPDDIVDCHDTTSPALSGVAPMDGTTNVALDVNVGANFSEAMSASTITGASFTLTLGGVPVSASVSYDPTTNKATLNPNAALQAGKTYTAKVNGGSAGVKDSAGNPMAADKVWSFTTLPPPDTTPPTLSGVAPMDGVTNVALDANVGANFSEAMSASTITGASFTLTLGGVPVSASVSYDPTTNKATLNPNAALQAGKTYTAKVNGGSAGVKDSAGNPMAADKVWSFTMLPPPPTNTTAPRVTSTSPFSNATGVAPSANLTATFSEAMMISSLNTTTFKLFKVTSSGMSQVTNVVVSPSADGLKATLNPFGTSSTTNLARGTKYKAVVSTGAKDVAGLRLDQISSTTTLDQKTWTFTTSN